MRDARILPTIVAHARAIAGPKISAAVNHCATLPVDPVIAARARVNAANDLGRFGKEIAWSRPRPPAPKEMQSDWKPCSPGVPVADGLSIPDFLKRKPAAVSAAIVHALANPIV